MARSRRGLRVRIREFRPDRRLYARGQRPGLARTHVGRTRAGFGGIGPRHGGCDPSVRTAAHCVGQGLGLLGLPLRGDDRIAGTPQRLPAGAILILGMGLDLAQTACGRVHQIDQPSPIGQWRRRLVQARYKAQVRVGSPVEHGDTIRADPVSGPRIRTLKNVLDFAQDTILTAAYSDMRRVYW
jgi:hypothetical protein